jgi:hypothetical protein
MAEYMNKVLKDFLYGILILIVIVSLEYMISLLLVLLGEPGALSPEAYKNWELLLTALPAGLTTFVFAWLLKTNNLKVALRRSIIWTIIICLHFLLLGIGYDNLQVVFGSVGIYLLLACAFAGPLFCAKIKR